MRVAATEGQRYPVSPVSRRTGVAVAAAVAIICALAPITRARAADPLIRVIVSKVAAADPRPEAELKALGGRVEHELKIIDGFSGELPSSEMTAFDHAPGVRSVTPDGEVHFASQMGQSSGTASAVYTDATRASKVWGMGDTGGGVNVAVIDTGINTTGDLAGKVVQAVDFTSENNNQDSYGHGTFVAGLIAGSGAGSNGAVMGMAPSAGLISLKIAGASGATDVTMVLEALEWAVDYKDQYDIRVINLSLGFQSTQSYLIDPLDFAVERAWNAGIVVVTAAGNEGDTTPDITTPGNDPYVVTVGATDDQTTPSLNDDTVAPFSSEGPTTDGLTKPDLVASGKSVISSRSPGSTVDTNYPTSEVGTTYTKGSGTSFSTAITSGAAALIISRNWSLTPNQVKYRLMATARPLSSGVTPATGAGTLDAFGATFSNTTASANLFNVPSVGGGSLQATRGPNCITDSTGACLSDANANTLLGFDPNAYFSNSWAGSQWLGSQWLGNSLAGSQWVGSQWVGTQWVGSQWVGSQWAGTQWVGSQWVGTQWVGSQWVANNWSGSQWASSATPWAGWQS